jgi:FAD/FMN-containing dehydrogenase/Fe-S oxidoreductase
METSGLIADLRRAGVGDIDGSTLARALYSSDASLYRVLPQLVVRPRHADEIVATLDVCRTHRVPITVRGAGTSIAGNAVGPGVVVDTSRYLDRVVNIDPDARTARVQPGVVQASLQRAAEAYGLRFGPDPSTHNRCTIGGMIGNNACGSRALGYGRTSDNVVALDVVTGSGERLVLTGEARLSGSSGVLAALEPLVGKSLATIRTEFGRFSRQASGYALEALLPERGFDVATALVGSEGTLALVLDATVRLVTEPVVRVLVVLGYPTMADAADAAPGLVGHHPTACEGLDARMIERVRAVPHAEVPDLPRGEGWLIVELTGGSAAEAADRAARLVSDAQVVDSRIVTQAMQMAVWWRIREDGAGLAARTADGRPAHAGWEDAAVPPDRLGEYLRRFEELLGQYGLAGLPYGHFGDGCIHIRIDFPFGSSPDRAASSRASYRSFVHDAAALVAGFGGSMSGEHGDGRARSELLPTMYSSAAIELFGRVKGLFDPDNLLNPGVLVDPVPIDDAIRWTTTRRPAVRLGLAYRHDGGDLVAAVHRCTGVGKCRADLSGAAGVMCPSYQATKDEKDSTRGRARVLQELMAAGSEVADWRSPAIHEALDLCLSCKGCARDCPTGIDMASYKTEVLYQSYRRRLRPRAHYALGWLPRWADIATRMPGLTNRLIGGRLSGGVAKAIAGVDGRRDLPAFAQKSFQALWSARGGHGDGGQPVALWIDTFTDHFAPEVALAAVDVLESAGYAVDVVSNRACCGLTWITTGQLGAARAKLSKTVALLRPYLDAGTPVVVLEPSCLAVLRVDTTELVDADDARRLGARVHTLAELLTNTPGWTPPDLSSMTVVAQPHCHHHAVLGWDTDAALLNRTGAQVTRVAGCCGLAGNWGVERGHYDVSVAIAEQNLLPAVRIAGESVVVLADGFSCRTQLAQLAGRRALHLAELLANRKTQDTMP